MYDKLKQTSESLLADSGLISEERKALLNELGIYIQSRLNTDAEVKLLFICSRNSRRSLMAQIWAQTAAEYFGYRQIRTFSGGIQKSLFHDTAIQSLRASGFKIKMIKEGKNPVYKIKFCKKAKPIIAFSKKHKHKTNPKHGFVAIMTCTEAALACPIIQGADYRTTLSYDDPRQYDRTKNEEKGYRDICLEIGREMFYVFKNIAG